MNRNLSYLDNIRINEGNDKCKEVFSEIYNSDRSRAVQALNDPLLSFPCLFILMPLIQSEQNLNFRNNMAIQLFKKALNPKTEDGSKLLLGKDEKIHNVLKWMFETANSENLFDDDYEEVMDVTVSVLLDIYGDRNILPAVAELIFKRSREGRLIHDLAWAFFRLHDPISLKLVADRLRSTDANDSRLACNLLNIEENRLVNSERLYKSVINQIEENDPFLYFTGESFQYKSKPNIYAVDTERKYFFKGIPTYDKEDVVPENENERIYLNAFQSLSDNEKEILSRYSLKLHNENLGLWKSWMRKSIYEQLNSAITGGEDGQ